MLGEIIFVSTIVLGYLFLRNPRKKYKTHGSHYVMTSPAGEIPTVSTRTKIGVWMIYEEEGHSTAKKLKMKKDGDKYTLPIFKPSYLGADKATVTIHGDEGNFVCTIQSDEYVDLIALSEKWKQRAGELKKERPKLEILEE